MTATAPGVTYSDLIVEALTRYPTREAFVLGDRRMTYAEAADRTGRLIAAFGARGVGLGSAVAALSGNRPEVWLAQAAAYLLGASFTGLQTLATLDDQVFICDDANISVLVVDDDHAGRAEEIAARASTVKHVVPLGRIDLLSAAAAPLSAGPAGEEDVAWLQYTGGTTGRPKGAMVPQRAKVQQAMSLLASWGLPEEPRYLAASPISHAAVLPVLPTLLRGGTVVLLRTFDPEAWLRAVQDEHINYAFAVPTMLYAALDHARPEAFDLSSLQTVIYGAAPMSPARVLEARERIGPVLQQAYGQSENAATATTLRRDEHDPAHPEWLASCGRAVVGARVAILDEDGVELAPGEIGEICVRTRAAMLGYRNLPAESAETLRDGWVRSGDMGQRDDDGYFYIVDRKKDMIISGGYNIYAREVEDALGTHPAIANAAVIGVPDNKWGEAVTAIVVPRPGATIDPDELTAYVRERKGPLHAPKIVQVVDALPMTPVGKIDKKVLRAPYWADAERQVH